MARKKGNKKSKQRQARPRRRNVKFQASGAPASVSDDITQFTRFLPTNTGEGITMHTCCAVAEIGAGIGTTAGLFASSGNSRYSATLSPTNPIWKGIAGAIAADGWISPVWDLIGSTFTRYRVKELQFHYAPQSTTTVEGRLVFGFAADPVHPLVYAEAGLTPTQASLLAVADSVPFAPWRAWTIDVSHRLDGDNELYLYNPVVASQNTDWRFSNFGSLAVVTDQASLEAEVKYGVLYMETKIELLEFCPISVTRPSLVFLREKLSMSTEKEELAKKSDVEISTKLRLIRSSRPALRDESDESLRKLFPGIESLSLRELADRMRFSQAQ